jgi:hypothetical protein
MGAMPNSRRKARLKPDASEKHKASAISLIGWEFETSQSIE